MVPYIILLRGVMPVGNNKVPMAQLRAALTEAGLTDVRTYIQSGNVLAVSDLDQAGIENLVHDTIKEYIGANIAVIARTAKQFRHILEINPFHGEEISRQYFSLFAEAPDPVFVQQLIALDFSPDQVRYTDQAIYSLYAIKYSDSRFNNNFFERRLKVAITTRNFNTMTRLVEMCTE